MTPALCNRKAFPNFPRPNSNLDSIAWNFVNLLIHIIEQFIYFKTYLRTIYSKVKLLVGFYAKIVLNSKECEFT